MLLAVNYLRREDFFLVLGDSAIFGIFDDGDREKLVFPKACSSCRHAVPFRLFKRLKPTNQKSHRTLFGLNS